MCLQISKRIPENFEKRHRKLPYVSKNVLHWLFNSWTQVCYVDKCKITVLPNIETFHLRACLKSIFKYFNKRWKVVPGKEYQLSLDMTSRCLLTSIFKIYIKFSFFWYIGCLLPKMSNTFEKYPLTSWSTLHLHYICSLWIWKCYQNRRVPVYGHQT